MEQTNNSQVKVNKTHRARARRKAKSLAVLASGVLAVVAAVRAQEASAPSTQPSDAVTATKIISATGGDARLASDDGMPTSAPAMDNGNGAVDANGGAGHSNMVSSGTDGQGRLNLVVNKSAVINTRVPYKTVSVGQPDIADVNPLGPGALLVTGKKAGTTQLIIFDDNGRSQIIDVSVVFDLASLQDQIKAMFPDSSIEVKSLNGAVALRGRVPSLEVASQVVAVAAPYSQKVLNFLEVGGGQQVQLQVRFAEVSRSAINALGVNLGFTDGLGFGASNIGQTNPFGTTGGVLGETLVPSTPGGGGSTVTEFGHFGIGNTAVDVFVSALRQNNLLRMLAEPNLVAVSGQNASFLAGGQIPIPVPQPGAGGSAVTIEYKEYGVKLNFCPVALGDGRIRLKLSPEVSSLDYTHPVEISGIEVPGFTTRRVETTIELNEGQTFAIAGLLQNNQTSSKYTTPLLGDLPVVGALFRSVRFERDETELVVLVTPKLVEGLSPEQTPAVPGEHWRDPTELDLFLNRDLGGDLANNKPTTQPTDDRPAARFHGSYGYAPATQPDESAAASDGAADDSATH